MQWTGEEWKTREFWIEHRGLPARELTERFPQRKWRTWQNRITWSKSDDGFPELYAPADLTPERLAKMRDEDLQRREEERRSQYKETTERRPDGTRVSDKLIDMNEAQDKDDTFLLQAHGFDPAEWEIITVRNSKWHAPSKDNEGNPQTVVCYSSKITVKPREKRFEMSDLVAVVTAPIKPVKLPRPRKGKRLLELSYTDMHLGNSDLAHYADPLARSLERIESQRWAEIIIWVGSDYFHCDNFKNTTANGTPQSSVWWPDAWADGLGFIGPIIEAALKHGVKVRVYYIPGNHDQSMTWAFCMTLAALYPQADIDTDIQNRKVHVFGDCAIGMTHGDEKTRANLDRVFVSEFPQFAAATHREVHMGHLHHERTVDNFGVTSRSLATAARTDKWHRESGYVGARKRFQLFEWDERRGVTDIHYV